MHRRAGSYSDSRLCRASPHRRGERMGEESLLDHLQRVARRDLVDVEVAGARDDRAPELLDLALRLSEFREDVEEDAIPFPQPPAAAHAEDRGDRRSEAKLLRDRDPPLPQEARGQMQRRRQRRHREPIGLVRRIRPEEGAMPLDLVEDAGPLVEVEQVGAAAEHHVLAVVEDPPAAGVFEGSGSSAETRAGLDHLDATPRLRKPQRRGETGESAADDDDRVAHRVAAVARTHRRPRRFASIAMQTLRSVLSPTRREPATRAGSASIRSRMPE